MINKRGNWREVSPYFTCEVFSSLFDKSIRDERLTRYGVSEKTDVERVSTWIFVSFLLSTKLFTDSWYY